MILSNVFWFIEHLAKNEDKSEIHFHSHHEQRKQNDNFVFRYVVGKMSPSSIIIILQFYIYNYILFHYFDSLPLFGWLKTFKYILYSISSLRTPIEICVFVLFFFSILSILCLSTILHQWIICLMPIEVK